jgi:hypothetical protein
MQTKLNFGLLLILCLQSCIKPDIVTNPLLSFESFKEVKNVRLNVSDSLIRVWDLTLVDDVLFVRGDGPEFLFSLINPRSDYYLGDFGRLGQGPCELSKSVFLNRFGKNGDILGVFDASQIRFLSILISSVQNIEQEPECIPSSYSIAPNVMKLVKTDSINFIASTLSDKPYELYRGNEKILSIGAYPFQESFANASGIELALAYQLRLYKNPTKSIVLSTSSFSFNMDVLSLNEKQNLEISSSQHFWPTSFEASSTSSSFSSTILPDAVFGNISTAVSADKIYVLYNDLPWNNDLFQTSKRILVYDWDLNPIEILELDQEVSRIAVHEDDNYLVGYVDDGKANLFRFDLR